MNRIFSNWGRVFGTTVGATLAGPGGAVLGGVAGLLVERILPGLADQFPDLLENIASNLSAGAVEKAGTSLVHALSAREQPIVNHDLQTAFRDAFRAAICDLGGPQCFAAEWRQPRLAIPPHVVYAQSTEGRSLWPAQGPLSPLASQVCECLHSLRKAVSENRLLPLQPPSDQPAADVRGYLDAATPGDLSATFFDQAVAPHLAPYGSLSAELPGLVSHLRRHSLDWTLVHLGETLKQYTPAWRAFNRLLLEGVQAEVRQLDMGQEEILERLDALVSEPDNEALTAWSEGLVDLVAATGRIEKTLDEGFDTVLGRVLAQHGEVMARFDHLDLTAGRIEIKVDRVLESVKEARWGTAVGLEQPGDEPPAPGEPPYKGMRYFDQADADLFFGREALTADLLRRISEQRLLVVVGASGSGKSSVIRAGLIPALKRGEALANGVQPPSGSADWPVHVITPTAHPLKELAASLTRDSESVRATSVLMDDLAKDLRSLDLAVHRILSHSSADRLLLIVDQFEELFSQCRDEGERKAFVENLLTAVSPETEGRTVLVIALRADFYGHCAQYGELRDALEKHQRYIGAMTEDELRRAIEEPARLGDWELEPGLLDLILRDVGDEPGALPLLSHALLETWRRRRGRCLTLAAYDDTGGVHGAIAHTAETVYSMQLTPEQQAVARSIFLRLTDLGEGTQDTRRRATLDELVPQDETAPIVEAVLKTLADARLISTSEGTAEVAHEALIREWPTLQEWLNRDRDFLLWRQRLGTLVDIWQESDRAEGALLREALLEEARVRSADRLEELSALECAYLEESEAAARRAEAAREAARQRELQQARELAEEQKQRAEEQAEGARKVRRLAVVLAAVFVLALAAAVVAGILGRQSSNNAATAIANLAAADAASTRAAANLATADIASTRAIANAATATANLATADVASTQAVGNAATATANLATADVASTRAIANAATAQANAHISRARELAGHSASQLDRNLDLALLLGIEAWEKEHLPQTRRALFQTWGDKPELSRFLHLPGRPLTLARSADGRLAVGSLDGTVTVWDLEGGQPALALKGHSGRVYSVAWSADGRLASGSEDGTVIVWDLEGGQPALALEGHSGRVYSAAWSADGRLASGSDHSTVIIWDLESGQPAQTLEGHGHDAVTTMAWSADGRLASGSTDGTVIVWDLERGLPAQTLEPPVLFVLSVAWSADGRLAAAGAFGGTVIVWDLEGGRPAQTLEGHRGRSEVTSLAWSADGQLASGADDQTVIVWDVERGLPSEILEGHSGSVMSVAWSTNRQLTSVSYDGTVIVWDLEPRVSALALEEGAYVGSVAWSADGQLASAGPSAPAIVWDLGRGEPDQYLVHRVGLDHLDSASVVAWSADGRLASGSSRDNNTIVWDLVSGPSALALEGHTGRVTSVAWSADGRLASGSVDGRVIVWDLERGKPAQILEGLSGGVYSVAWSADGQIACATGSQTSSFTGTVIIWDLAGGEPAQTLIWSTGRVTSVAWSADGRLASGSWDNMVIIWDLEYGGAAQILEGHRLWVNSVAWSADGRLASGSEDSTVIVWDLERGLPARVLEGHTARVTSVAWSADGRLASGSADRMIWVWPTTPEELARQACQRAGRNFTQSEWSLYFPDEEYRETCDEWPAGE